jgi:hypothetical protein
VDSPLAFKKVMRQGRIHLPEDLLLLLDYDTFKYGIRFVFDIFVEALMGWMV